MFWYLVAWITRKESIDYMEHIYQLEYILKVSNILNCKEDNKQYTTMGFCHQPISFYTGGYLSWLQKYISFLIVSICHLSWNNFLNLSPGIHWPTYYDHRTNNAMDQYLYCIELFNFCKFKYHIVLCCSNLSICWI